MCCSCIQSVASVNTQKEAVEMQSPRKRNRKYSYCAARRSDIALSRKIPSRCLCYSNPRSISSTSYLQTKCGVLRVEIRPGYA
jgi:hypothetical protein